MEFQLENLTDPRNGGKFTRETLFIAGKNTGFSFDYDSEDSNEKIDKWRSDTFEDYRKGVESVEKRKERILKFKSNPDYYKSLIIAETKKVIKVEDFGLGESGNYLQSLEEGEYTNRTYYKAKEGVSKEDYYIIKQAIESGLC